MAPSYKLVYFDGRGAGETIRYLFKYGNIEFEDVRIKQEEWPQHKEKTPFGQLPFLEHNGKKVNQSSAIARYVGKQVGLGGKNDWENLEIDAIADTFNDLRTKIGAAFFESDPEKKKSLTETLIKETFPFYLEKFEAIAQKNNGHLAAGRLTWVDLHFASSILTLDTFVGGKALEKYPTLTALVSKVNAIPAIKKWIETRPKTLF